MIGALLGLLAARRTVGVGGESLVDRTSGSVIGDMTGGAAQSNAYDGDMAQSLAGGTGPCPFRQSARGYIGKDFTAEGAKRYSRFKIYGSDDDGFVFNENVSTTLEVYAKNGAPSSGQDGTLIGSVTFIDADDESAGREIESTDTVNAYTHVWVYVNSSVNTSTAIAEIEMWESL